MIQNWLGLGKRLHAVDGLLDHRLFAVECQQLFRTPFAAKRPEACAAASSEDDGIEISFYLFCHELKPILHARFGLGQTHAGN